MAEQNQNSLKVPFEFYYDRQNVVRQARTAEDDWLYFGQDARFLAKRNSRCGIWRNGNGGRAFLFALTKLSWWFPRRATVNSTVSSRLLKSQTCRIYDDPQTRTRTEDRSCWFSFLHQASDLELALLAMIKRESWKIKDQSAKESIVIKKLLYSTGSI